MPRRSRLRRAALFVLSFALVVIVGMGFGIGASPAGAASPTPTPTSSPGSTGSSTAKPPTVTFGLGPSNGKGLDGRQYFSYAASPGSTISDHFAIVNISNQTLDLLVYGVDATTNASGALAYQPHSAARKDAGAWLATPLDDGSNVFPVKGRSTLVLPFQLRIPKNASPGDHTAGLAVGLIAQIQGKSTKNLDLEQRVVAEVYVRVSGTAVAKLAVTNLHASYSGTANPFGTGSAKITYTVHNAGNVDLGAKQQVSVSGLFGGTGSTPSVPALTDLVPGASTTVSVVVHGVLPLVLLSAKVKVTPVALPNAVDPPLHAVSASSSLWAIPWALLLLIVILIALYFAYRRYAAHRRATQKQPKHGRAKSEPTPPLVTES